MRRLINALDADTPTPTAQEVERAKIAEEVRQLFIMAGAIGVCPVLVETRLALQSAEARLAEMTSRVVELEACQGKAKRAADKVLAVVTGHAGRLMEEAAGLDLIAFLHSEGAKITAADFKSLYDATDIPDRPLPAPPPLGKETV